MRLHEFSDPNDYRPTEADAPHFVKQLQRIWSDRSDCELTPIELRNREKPLDKRRRLLDAMNACRN